MNYYLGIDAGGTKTQAVLINEEAKILARTRGGPANYHNVGIERATRNVINAINRVIDQAQIAPEKITWLTIGIAGFDTAKDYQKLHQAFTTDKLQVFKNKLTLVNDTKIGLYSGTTPPGIVVICGTGCNVYGINAHSEEAVSGNWGHFFGDKGSGYALGKKMFETVIEVYDGRSEPTELAEKLSKRIEVHSAEDLMDWYYEEKPTIREISDFVPMIIETAASGDLVAKDLVDGTVKELGRAIMSVVKKLKLENEYNRIVIIGGVFKSKYFRGVFEGHVTALLKRVRVVKPLVPIAVGAALMGKLEYEKKPSVNS